MTLTKIKLDHVLVLIQPIATGFLFVILSHFEGFECHEFKGRGDNLSGL